MAKDAKDLTWKSRAFIGRDNAHTVSNEVIGGRVPPFSAPIYACKLDTELSNVLKLNSNSRTRGHASKLRKFRFNLDSTKY